ncbi:glutamyl-tRNA(Gln) amidotransferase subunit C, mitochondrial-like [Eriocheir sinensis]|uniref:glutamyl-tRNA(Gln) amidotransferase subunit C, mitochondrial-like n=1 Tax=Eriocheir sinensis TaxID=95602 RepID=UPI0021CAAC06|nr:glutamyl-tRNA(Gln) amidotransferase subunit C, mitochondrial-like [Eriocheir sinensis]
MSVAPLRPAVLGPLRWIPCPSATSFAAATASATATASITSTHRRWLSTHSRTLCSEKRVSKVPQQPTTPTLPPGQPVQVDLRLVQLLERLSLVDFANEEGVERLQEAISMADRLSQVDTTGVEPLITVLEDRSLPLAEDEVEWGSQKDELLACAHSTVEDYFVVPPGNITYEEERGYHATLKQQQAQQQQEEEEEDLKKTSRE